MDKLSPEEEKLLNDWFQPGKVIDVNNAEKALGEVKKILDSFGITFFLLSGTCLGAVRDNGLMPWDDDVDLGSIIGLHGFNEDSLEKIGTKFQDNGFIARLDYYGPNSYIQVVKYSTLVNWTCFRVRDDHIEQFPSLNTPFSFFTNLKEITFLNEKYYVPNPPEEFLRFKYGDEWNVPKKTGDFEGDVLRQALVNPPPSVTGRFRHSLARYLPWEKTCKIRVFGEDGKPVVGAEVTAVGLGNMKTNRNGCVEFHVPQEDYYPVMIRYGGFEKIDYLQRMTRGIEHIYKLSE